MEYWGEKLPPRSARSPTSVHENACVHSRPFARADPLHRRNLRSAVHVAYLRSNLLYLRVRFFFTVVRALFFLPRVALLAARENSEAYAFPRRAENCERCMPLCDRLKFQSTVASTRVAQRRVLPFPALLFRVLRACAFSCSVYLFRNCRWLLSCRRTPRTRSTPPVRCSRTGYRTRRMEIKKRGGEEKARYKRTDGMLVGFQ